MARSPSISRKSDDRGHAAAPRTARSKKAGQEDGALADRRAQILEASARLFAEYGFETTSVRQIADEVNILAGSLYHHFSNKDEILHEIIREPVAQVMRDLIRVSQLPVDAEHRLVTYAILRFRREVENWNAHAILQHDTKFLRRREDFSYVADSGNFGSQVIRTILNDGMDSGLFHPGIDIYMIIATISRLLNSASGWIHLRKNASVDEPGGVSLDRNIDFHLDCILRLVRAASRVNEPIPRKVCEQLIAAMD